VLSAEQNTTASHAHAAEPRSMHFIIYNSTSMPQGCEGVDKSGSKLRYALKVEAPIDALRPPDSIVSVLVRAPIRYAGHSESKSGLIILLLQSPGALLWHRPAPEDVDFASGALCHSQCRSSIMSCPKDDAKAQRVRVKSWCPRFCIGAPYSTLLPIVDTKSLSHRSFTPAPLLSLPAKEPRCQPPYRNSNLMGHIMAKVRRPFMDLTL
jgi:hypothetical protein